MPRYERIAATADEMAVVRRPTCEFMRRVFALVDTGVGWEQARRKVANEEPYLYEEWRRSVTVRGR